MSLPAAKQHIINIVLQTFTFKSFPQLLDNLFEMFNSRFWTITYIFTWVIFLTFYIASVKKPYYLCKLRRE